MADMNDVNTARPGMYCPSELEIKTSNEFQGLLYFCKIICANILHLQKTLPI